MRSAEPHFGHPFILTAKLNGYLLLEFQINLHRAYIFPVLFMFPYVVDKNVIRENVKNFIWFLTSIPSPFSNEL